MDISIALDRTRGQACLASGVFSGTRCSEKTNWYLANTGPISTLPKFGVQTIDFNLSIYQTFQWDGNLDIQLCQIFHGNYVDIY